MGKPYPKVNKSKCNTCESCIFECPFDAISISFKTGRAEINPKKCRRCMRCIEVCPRHAIEV